MTTFLQLHMLTSYPPACLNRDDLNRPKTAVMGGVPRLRISSQSLKRAWRESDIIKETLAKYKGTKTRILGKEIMINVLPKDNPTCTLWIDDLMPVYGEPDGKKAGISKQIVFISPAEECVLREFLEDIKLHVEGKPVDNDKLNNIIKLQQERDKKKDSDEKKKVIEKIVESLREHLLNEKVTSAFDIAMFGRMLASSPKYNIEAACQVAHAITVHKVAVEDDFFTAVEELNKRAEDTGSAHMGEQGFASGLFYLYVCIDCDSLVKNLGGDSELANKAIRAITAAAATVSPTGKQNSFGSRAWASYIMAEKGTRQPRSLSVAFLKPVKSGDMLEEAISSLETTCHNLDKVYFKGVKLPSEKINGLKGEGDLEKLLNFVAQ